MANPISKAILMNTRRIGFRGARGMAKIITVFCFLAVFASAEEDISSCSWEIDGECHRLPSHEYPKAESLLQVKKFDPFADAVGKPGTAATINMLSRDLTPAEIDELATQLNRDTDSKGAVNVSSAFSKPSGPAGISLASSASMISGDMAGQETGLGAHVPLSEAGYVTVLKEASNGEMETFLKRAIDDLGLELVEPDSLKHVVPWYSGEEGSASFGEFKGKILNSLGQEGAWVKEAEQKLHSGKDAPVSNEGYLQVAKLKNNEEMGYFVEKVVQDMGFTVVNYGGIHGLVPFYSGENQVQNLSSLKLEILRAALTPGSWVQANKNSGV
jgi:hypothetical protein